jgi:hypothetical protein
VSRRETKSIKVVNGEDREKQSSRKKRKTDRMKERRR